MCEGGGWVELIPRKFCVIVWRKQYFWHGQERVLDEEWKWTQREKRDCKIEILSSSIKPLVKQHIQGNLRYYEHSMHRIRESETHKQHLGVEMILLASTHSVGHGIMYLNKHNAYMCVTSGAVCALEMLVQVEDHSAAFRHWVHIVYM